MSVDEAGAWRYRAVFTDRTASRLWVAATISYLGDFVGLGALLLIAYERSGGHALGSAAVFGVQAVPAGVVAVGIGPWLDRIPRRGGLVTLCLLGAAAMALPLVAGGLPPVLGAAAVLGGVRSAFNAIRAGVIAENIPRDVRGRLIALISTSNQVSEVFGYLAGSGVTLAAGPRPALAGDAATFAVAALLIGTLRLAEPARSARRASMTTGIRTIFADPTLSLLAPVTWIGLSLGALPQTLAPAALAGAHRAWTPAALAAMAAGLAISATVVGRTGLGERVLGQFRYIVVCGLVFVLTAVALRGHPLLLVAGNFAIGLGTGWTVAAQTTFLLVTPPARMAHVTGTMIASLVALEGAGAVAFGAIAGAAGVPAAYLAAGVMLIVAGFAGARYGRTHPRSLDLSRPDAAKQDDRASAQRR
ncbi:MAG TPA: MFS transporter [Streptosporangiaceae bacterium]|nr:MFS transporter [Streptosporangiaceae bacterium]